MSAPEERTDRELLRAYHQQGDVEARERLIEQYLPLVFDPDTQVVVMITTDRRHSWPLRNTPGMAHFRVPNAYRE